jgi:hypothetical protein
MPPPGPVLEAVTPGQLATMGLGLESTVQPFDLPDWAGTLGVRAPAGILLRRDAETAVRKNAGGVRSVGEIKLAYATLQSRMRRARGPLIVHRLVWIVVGTRATAGSAAGLVDVLWLVDARSGRQLDELQIPIAVPAAAGAGSSGGGGGGP